MSRALLIAMTACTVASTALGADVQRSYSATAYSLDGGEALYVERHVETLRDGRLAEREVRYIEPDGDLIAEKVVRYGRDVEAPSFEMVDVRRGVREGADVRADEVALYSGDAADAPRRKVLDKPETAVVDAGFDAFMRENFPSIKAGDALEFEFAVPAMRRFVRFEVLSDGRVSYDGEPALAVRMRPAMALLRLLVDPIELTYSLDGRLLEFRGMANVLDPQGERYEARIVFDYSAEQSAERVGAAR